MTEIARTRWSDSRREATLTERRSRKLPENIQSYILSAAGFCDKLVKPDHLIDFIVAQSYGEAGRFVLTITVDIRPEAEAELIRQAAARGRAIEVHAATLLEDAVHLQGEPACVRTGQALIDACAKVSGLFSDEEVDTLFNRTPAFARAVDFE